MGWADDMYEKGYTKEHGGLMEDTPSRSSRSMRYKSSNGKNKIGPGSKWTEYDSNQMIQMYSADVSIRRIAKKLNRTPYSIAYRLFNQNKISENTRHKFKGDSSFDTSISLIMPKKNAGVERIFNEQIRHIKNTPQEENTTVSESKMGTIVTIIIVLIAGFIIINLS